MARMKRWNFTKEMKDYIIELRKKNIYTIDMYKYIFEKFPQLNNKPETRQQRNVFSNAIKTILETYGYDSLTVPPEEVTRRARQGLAEQKLMISKDKNNKASKQELLTEEDLDSIYGKPRKSKFMLSNQCKLDIVNGILEGMSNEKLLSILPSIHEDFKYKHDLQGDKICLIYIQNVREKLNNRNTKSQDKCNSNKMTYLLKDEYKYAIDKVVEDNNGSLSFIDVVEYLCNEFDDFREAYNQYDAKGDLKCYNMVRNYIRIHKLPYKPSPNRPRRSVNNTENIDNISLITMENKDDITLNTTNEEELQNDDNIEKNNNEINSIIDIEALKNQLRLEIREEEQKQRQDNYNKVEQEVEEVLQYNYKKRKCEQLCPYTSEEMYKAFKIMYDILLNAKTYTKSGSVKHQILDAYLRDVIHECSNQPNDIYSTTNNSYFQDKMYIIKNKCYEDEVQGKIVSIIYNNFSGTNLQPYRATEDTLNRLMHTENIVEKYTPQVDYLMTDKYNWAVKNGSKNIIDTKNLKGLSDYLYEDKGAVSAYDKDKTTKIKQRDDIYKTSTDKQEEIKVIEGQPVYNQDNIKKATQSIQDIVQINNENNEETKSINNEEVEKIIQPINTKPVNFNTPVLDKYIVYCKYSFNKSSAIYRWERQYTAFNEQIALGYANRDLQKERGKNNNLYIIEMQAVKITE